MIFGKDHDGYLLTSRDRVEENVVYRDSGVRRLIPRLRAGDRIRIQREGESYGQMLLTVTEGDDNVIYVEDDNLQEYTLYAEWMGRQESMPWLRYDGRSEGPVTRITVIEKADS